MGRKCEVSTCSNNEVKRNGTSFIKFPRNPTVAIRWVQFCDSEELLVDYEEHGEEVLANRKICSAHFAEEDFRIRGRPDRGLRFGVVPRIVGTSWRDPPLLVQDQGPQLEEEDVDAATNSSVLPIVVDEEWLEALNESNGEPNSSLVLGKRDTSTARLDKPDHNTTMRRSLRKRKRSEDCKLRECRVKLKIDAKGMLATFGGSIDKHNHMNELDKLMECPEGKGMVQFDGREQPFWLLYGERQRSQYTRSLIFAGQKYLLQSIRFKGLIGVWKCHHVFRKCTALLRIDPLFEKFEMRGRHNHPPLAQWEIDHALRLRGIRDGSLEAIRTYQRTTSRVAIEKRADQEGYLEDNSTLWKCAMFQLRNCKAIAKVSLDGKQLTFIERKHNHETRPLELLNYPLGKRMIAGEPVWLLKWFNANHESRRVLYRGYLYTLHEIGKHGIIRWRCLRRQSCAAILLSEGDFRKMEVKGEHTHLGLPQSSMDSLVKDTEPAGRRVQKSVEQPATAQPLPMPIYTTISQHNPEKNYTVKQLKKQLLVVTFDGRDFRFNAKESTGFSQWSCVWSDIRLCKVKLYISPDGKSARLHESDHKHNHSDGDVPAFKLADGKRTIFDETKNVDQPYYLYTYPAEFFPNRGLIYQGQKYTLCRIDRNGHSTWKCPRTCTGYIKVECSLRSIACKNSHQHAA
ncbi:hypothetical protein pipiens_011633 [Culex pipiens pipiens]|uniref:THAP-type domain-containing protein n=1 Tax=Culex pipiens pipiens TaxID=38569 RepID=A0ABD1D5I4_CULPP